MSNGLVCQVCGDPGYLVAAVPLRALLCFDCDNDFTAWFSTRPGAPLATDWPRWHRRAGVEARVVSGGVA